MVRRYKLKDEQLNADIKKIVEDAKVEDEVADSVSDLISTCISMGQKPLPMRDMIISSASLREIYRTFLVFSQEKARPRVSIFGSARTKPDNQNYKLCYNFSKKIANQGWMIVSGAGPGIMEASILGAGKDNSFGVSIKLPFEPEPIEAITNSPFVVNYRYFFTRKLAFMKEVSAFVLFPGGFGTMDELFELITLVHTGKTSPAPIVLIEEKGGKYWLNLLKFVKENLLEHKYISIDDFNLATICHSSDDALAEINHFYKVYNSIRFVNKELVMRLNSTLDADFCEHLTKKYSDFLVEGKIELSQPTDAEIKDNDLVDLPRIKFKFDRHKWGLLRKMINEINNYSAQG